METKKENDEFLDLHKKFNEVNDAATRQKKDNEVIDLIDDIKDQDNPFNDTFKADPEYMIVLIKTTKKDVKMVSDDILQDENLDQNDILFEELPTDPVKRQIIKPNARLKLAVNKIKKNTTDKKIGKT